MPEEVERAVRDSVAGPGEFQLHEFRLVEVGDTRAYRMESTLRVGAVSVRQLQYVLSGRATFVVTFSAPAETFDERREEFERMTAGIRIENRAGILDEMPAWFCGGVLGIAAFLAAAARRKGLRGGQGWLSVPLPGAGSLRQS